ncbi:hypothetical protein BDA99DRAFT_494084 [Phascolomyces articulosus]|uniref:F-box domain-containing protein n=1 Tax=Phascolomyces articulosus TaxID=60185 RepID=A0AAD5PL30_9FUNG|nr:hypothetical protein BDA99DRAFT_494084 [Phascolomyces articulosus]
MNILEFNNELLTAIAGHLTVEDLKTFSIVCHRFAIIAHDDATWREMLYNTFGVTYKLPKDTWKQQFERKCTDPKDNRICPHLGAVTRQSLEPYKAPYNNVINRKPPQHNCVICAQNHYDSGLCLYIYNGNNRIRCKDCAYKFHAMRPGRHGILLRIPVLQMYCFTCSRQLGESRGDESEEYYVDHLLENLTHDSELGRQQLVKRRQCMFERGLYLTEADRKSVLSATPCFYFVDRMWLWAWFLRLCDGKLAVEPITNKALEDEDGLLNRDARPKGGSTTAFSIVTPKLWNYLVQTYGLSGKAFQSNEIQGRPEYTKLWQSIDDWKLI